MNPFLLPLDIWSDIGRTLGAAMEPLYTAVSAILVFWHWLFAPLFGTHSGITWVLSIVFLTFVIRTIMIPLFVKTIQSSRNMQLIQPKLQELQKKYGADRERLGQETMKLYREEGVNPMSSCLPILIQMPIFWALFQVLSGVSRQPDMVLHGYFLQHNPELAQSLRDATFFGASLSGRFMPLTNFGPTQILAGVLILGMTIVLFITQLHMTRKNMTPEAMTGPFAQQQKMMLYVFPLIYLFTGISIPNGVLLYWFTTNVWTLVQQWILITNSPAPNTPAYLDWEAKMRAKGKDPREIERQRAAKRAAKRGRPVVDETAEPDGIAVDGEIQPRVQRQSVQRQTRVQRQGRATTTTPGSSTGATAASVVPGRKAGGGTVTPPADVPTVVRQQPRKTTRAVRRKGAPTQPGDAQG